ncbi:MAG: hypothetical protein DRN30_04845 [Thermoplasmata archaeon]|nr:MAG: hypothetical protein DRN30_04845 [Thermoplasmata archaeon]
MPRCTLCGFYSEEISSSIGVCVNCLRRDPYKALKHVKTVREKWREYIGLPKEPPRDGSVKCTLCVNECEISQGLVGYCGMIKNINDRLVPITDSFDVAYLHWYYDPLPTNCVADPVCPERKHYGYYNLAVFFAGCNLDCLFCQNIEHKYMVSQGVVHDKSKLYSVSELVEIAMKRRVACVCYFGGDPSSSIIYALKVSREILRRSKEENANKRICWETNGLENPNTIREMTKISLMKLFFSS